MRRCGTWRLLCGSPPQRRGLVTGARQSQKNARYEIGLRKSARRRIRATAPRATASTIHGFRHARRGAAGMREPARERAELLDVWLSAAVDRDSQFMGLRSLPEDDSGGS